MKKSKAKEYIKEQIKSFINEKDLKEPKPEDGEDEGGEEMGGGMEGEASIEDIQADLQGAFQKAQGLGDPKLSQQIANTISYFTKSHVLNKQAGAAGAGQALTMEVKDEEMCEGFERMQELAGIDEGEIEEYGLEHDPTQVEDEDFDHPAVKKDKKKEVKEEESGQPKVSILFSCSSDLNQEEFIEGLKNCLTKMKEGANMMDDLQEVGDWFENNIDDFDIN